MSKGLKAGNPGAPVRTTCAYCGVGCGILAWADGRIEGDPDHPANYGRLCSKGAALGETLGPQRRLLHPEIGGRRAGWEEALDLVARRFSEAIETHGPESVALYVSGQILTEDYYIANKLMKGFIGSANIDTNSRLCMASSVAGHKRAFGTDTVPGSYDDLEAADLVVLAGSNMAWCHPVLFRRLEAAREKNPKLRLVVIDPRRTASAEAADMHLAIAPDGDAALWNALLAAIAERGALDRAYLDAHVEGLDEALAAARASDPAASGLPAAEIARFIDLWLGTEKVVTVYSQGVNQSAHGSDKVNAIINCHLATGRIGRPGMGPFSVTGQPNAMGGREVGGLANMLACHLDLENPAHRAAVADFWQAPGGSLPPIPARPGLKAVDMFRACAEGKIKALWIIGTNPAVSLPRADRVAEAIAAVPFTVVSDITRTDTTARADVLLPALGWGEKSGTVTNSERRISRQRAFLPAPGEARADWRILCDVAARMGWGEAFAYTHEAEIFAEYAALSGRAAALGRDFDISAHAAITREAYDALAPFQWPAPADPARNPAPQGRFFAEGGFYHPGGKARMLAISPPARQAPAQGLFHLNTGRIRDQWHTMTRTGLVARLSAHLAEPFAEIHPEDAARLGLGAGDIVRLERAGGGAAVLRALVSEAVRPGEVFVPMHWNGANSTLGAVNPAVDVPCDPVSGQPALKQAVARIERLAASWYGFAASLRPIAPPAPAACPYGTVIRTATGWALEMAAGEMPDDWEAEARRLLDLPDASAALVEDPATGIRRIAFHEEGRLAGLFFAAPRPVALQRDHAIAQIGRAVAAGEALAGRRPAGQPDPGRIVCACFNVGENTLAAAIARGACTAAALGEATAAGTNCGACKPELDALLARHANTLSTAAE